MSMNCHIEEETGVKNRIGDINTDELPKEDSFTRENYFDLLTGLPNMVHFLEMAEAGEGRGEGSIHNMMAFDLVGMKYFNSKYGLKEGDKLLCTFADILRKHFGTDCCSRFGEDHFYAFSSKENVEQDLEAVFAELKEANSCNNPPVKVGIYKYDNQELPMSAVCDRAKMAADYDKKSFASSYTYFDESMKMAVEKKNYILQHLEQALSEKWIKVYYQPIIRSVTGSVCNEEALARWIDPTLGVISPVDFIPIIEEAKLLYKLDLYMVERVLEDIRDFKGDQLIKIVPVSVNVSRFDFEYCDMAGEIIRRVKEAGVPPKYLIIEITESVMELDKEFVKKQVDLFRNNGFKVWMDDFGSGYSSLNVLQDFEFDLIKLDMKFMRDFGRGKKSAGIIKKIIEMAEQLGVDTLAEGVEKEEQVEFLKEIGCDKLQGYLYSMPRPIEELVRRYNIGIGCPRENVDDAEYYDRIGRVSFVDPEANGDTAMGITENFMGIGFGVIEFDGYDSYRLLRSNQVYKEYIKMIYGRDSQVAAVPHYSERDQRHSYADSVRRCILSGNWEVATDVADSKDVKINTNTRVLTKSSVTGAYALLVIMTSEKRTDDETKEYNTEIGYGPNSGLMKKDLIDETIMKIARNLNTIEDYEVSMNLVLNEMSRIVNPDRLYVFERNGNLISMTFEWCRQGVKSYKDSMQRVPYDVYFKVWEGLVEKGNGTRIEDTAVFEPRYPELYEELRRQDVKKIIIMPVYSKGEIIGFIGADNYREEEKDDTEFLIISVAGFLSFRMANSILLDRLVFMADHDTLTSAFNRNAMISMEVEYASRSGSIGIVFIDLNGLKEVNDNYGHDAGDQLLIRASRFIARHYGIQNLYRAGGDEFVVMIPYIDSKQFDEKKEQFLRELSEENNLNMATGFVWISDMKDISEAIKEADSRMYKDKVAYYAVHDRRRAAR